MYFNCFFLSIFIVHQISCAYSRTVNLNLFDGRDLKTSLFDDDEPLLIADTSNKINPCTVQSDQQQLSSSFSNDNDNVNVNVNLFTRGPNPNPNPEIHEECLPPVNIGADVHALESSDALNLFEDPISELEQLVTQRKKGPDGTGGGGPPNGPGPGPETPGVPPKFDGPDEDEGGMEELFPIPNEEEEGWTTFTGPVYIKEGLRDRLQGPEQEIGDDQEGADDEGNDDDNKACREGYKWNLCCDGPPHMATSSGVEWQYDAVEACESSKF